jgi:hypothetical protein
MMVNDGIIKNVRMYSGDHDVFLSNRLNMIEMY